MLLYLSGNGKCGLIDAAVTELDINCKKLIGKFSLRSFVTKDMRNYAAAKYFVVDVDCIDDTDSEFCTALQSFQMMFSARIIVILSGREEKENLIQQLAAIGVVNIVTADTTDEATAELLECLSEEGMQRYVMLHEFMEEDVPKETAATIPHVDEIRKYRWNAKNVKIAAAGTQRRCGTTVTAMNLAYWLAARGADVCYVECNMNRHLRVILNLFAAEAEKEHYKLEDIDCYVTDVLDRDYDFIVYDCGVADGTSTVFHNADKRILCGSALPYELTKFNQALKLCGKLEVVPVAVAVPDEMKDYCTTLLGDKLLIAESSHSLFANNTNGHIYRPLVMEYIKE